MNKVDLENIEQIINYRESKPKYKKGGEFLTEDLEKMTTDELKNLADNFKGLAKNKADAEAKQIVDEMFQKYAKDGDNMIVLSAAYFPDHEIYEVDSPFDRIDFDRNERWNKLYYPIESEEDGYIVLWGKLFDILLGKLHIPYAEEEFENDTEALGRYWYGVVGIMKDYRVVRFIIRDDGMLSDNNGYNSTYNKVIYEIK